MQHDYRITRRSGIAAQKDKMQLDRTKTPQEAYQRTRAILMEIYDQERLEDGQIDEELKKRIESRSDKIWGKVRVSTGEELLLPFKDGPERVFRGLGNSWALEQLEESQRVCYLEMKNRDLQNAYIVAELQGGDNKVNQRVSNETADINPKGNPTRRPTKYVRLNFWDPEPEVALILRSKPHEARLQAGDKSFVSVKEESVDISGGFPSKIGIQGLSNSFKFAQMVEDTPFPMTLIPSTLGFPVPRQIVKPPFADVLPAIKELATLGAMFMGG